jgi:hypothetical protein
MAAMFACLLCERLDATPEGETLARFAREWSPRVETIGAGVVVLDAGGLARLFGVPDIWAGRLMAAACKRGWPVRVAVARTRMAAVLLAMGRSGVTVVAPGNEASIPSDPCRSQVRPSSHLLATDMMGEGRVVRCRTRHGIIVWRPCPIRRQGSNQGVRARQANKR